MNKEIKFKSNSLQSSSNSISNNGEEKKSAGCNDWNSVPRTYDKEESTHEHKKSATNNQWTSTSK